MRRRSFYILPFFLVSTVVAARRADAAECLVGDIVHREGDSIGEIGLECISGTTYDGWLETCSADGTIHRKDKSFTCPESAPYCVQCGPRGWGNALCLSTPTIDRDCGQLDFFETHPILCPDYQEPVNGTFCGIGPNRKDCGDEEFCYVDYIDRFAVCCANPKNCCDTVQYNNSVGGWGSSCCSDGNWYPSDPTGGNVCLSKELTSTQSCRSGYCCNKGSWYTANGTEGKTCKDKLPDASESCWHPSFDGLTKSASSPRPDFSVSTLFFGRYQKSLLLLFQLLAGILAY